MSEFHFANKQQGAALAVSLIILTLMTVIGVTAVKSSVIENRIATNMYDKQMSFEAAEAALRDAEAWLVSQETSPDAVKTAGGTSTVTVWVKGFPTNTHSDVAAAEEPLKFSDDSIWETFGEDYGQATGAASMDDLAATPQFIVEQFTFIPDDMSAETLAAGRGEFYYRITARARGGSSTSETLLQTIYRMRYN